MQQFIVELVCLGDHMTGVTDDSANQCSKRGKCTGTNPDLYSQYWKQKSL